MRNKKTKIIGIIVCVFILGIVTMIISFSKESDDANKKSLKEMFFNSSDEQYAKKIIDYNGKKYTIDDYTILLEETLYDRKTNIGYCVFSITKKNGKPEIELNKWNQSVTNGYGKNSRFKMETFASQESKFEIVGDTLYQYFSFRADDNFDGEINLVDAENNRKYKYVISDMNTYNKYNVNDDMKIYISPIGIVINSSSEMNGRIVLHYKDGQEEIVVDTKEGKDMGLSRVSHKNDKVRSLYVFQKIKKIEDINYILFNGEVYQKAEP